MSDISPLDSSLPPVPAPDEVAPTPRSETRAGPGLPESLLWVAGFFLLQLIWLVPILLVMMIANGSLGAVVAAGADPDFPATQQLLIIALPLVGTYLVLVPAGLWRLNGPLQQSLPLRLPTAPQFLILLSLVLPLAGIADTIFQWIEPPLKEFFSQHEALRSLEDLDLHAVLQKDLRSAPLWLLALCIAVVPALGEEFLFRGVLGRGLTARWGLFWGVMWTSLLFAMVHLYPPHVIAIFPLGVVLHLVYLSTRSFWAPVLLHFLNNFLAVVALKHFDEGTGISWPFFVVFSLCVIVGLSLLWVNRTIEPDSGSTAAGEETAVQTGLTFPRWGLVAAGLLLAVNAFMIAEVVLATAAAEPDAQENGSPEEFPADTEEAAKAVEQTEPHSEFSGALFAVQQADDHHLTENSGTSDSGRESMSADAAEKKHGVWTLGGRQFWGDVLFFRGWRIQQNVTTGHYRLLDPQDRRHCFGTREECVARLEAIKQKQQLPPMSGRAVILIHGIIRSSKSMSPLAERLAKGGATVVPFDYPSTQVPLHRSAEFLRQVIASLHGIEEIDLVVHSMGGLVVRTSLLESHGPPDPRLRRMVMLGVPNQGARLASLLQHNSLFKWVFGPAGQQLIEDPEGFLASLPAPLFEFAIIAGARGTEDGWNPLIPGDDDGTVSVECTRLEGAADFMTARALHTIMMYNGDVIEATARFLERGSLRESGVREGIPVSQVTRSTPTP